MGKMMSKERNARDLASKEYDEFMNKYKAEVEAGNPKLMQHMLKLEPKTFPKMPLRHCKMVSRILDATLPSRSQPVPTQRALEEQSVNLELRFLLRPSVS